MKLSTTFIALSLVTVSPQLLANDLSQANQTQLKTNQLSQTSQQKINHNAEQSMELTNQIAQLKEEIRNLSIYRSHLENLVSNQQQEQESLNDQIGQIKLTRQGIVPLMYQMLTSLELIVKSDKPIKLEQRLTRIDDLKRMMGRADVSDAEKYRRILEAFQIELDYGNKLSLYRDTITLDENQDREVELVAVGRLALLARSFDQQNYWYWSNQQVQWVKGDSSNLPQINQAFDVAGKKTPPSLLSLPISLVVAQEK